MENNAKLIPINKKLAMPTIPLQYPEIPGKLTECITAGHIPWRISRFCYYFNYGGSLRAKPSCTKYRPSPILSGGSEIPTILEFLNEYYTEPENIKGSQNNESEEKAKEEAEEEFHSVNWGINPPPLFLANLPPL